MGEDDISPQMDALLKRARLRKPDTTMSEDDTTIPNPGIGDDVRLSIECAAGPLLNTTLIMAAVAARYRMAMTVDGGPGEILPFLYRDPFDPEAPDAPRPLRRAVLAIVDDKIVPKGLVPGAEAPPMCREMETRRCPPAGPCGDRPCARFESDDPTPWQ